MTAEPGWYPDTTDSRITRYWNGSAWAGQRSWDGARWVDGPAAQPVAVAAQPPAWAPVGYPVQRPGKPTADQLRGRAVLILIGGVLMAVGSLLPWATADGISSVTGVSVGVGKFILALGLIVVLLAGLVAGGVSGKMMGVATLVLSALIMIISLILLAGVSYVVSGVDDIDGSVSVGIGLYLVVIGSIMSFVVSIVLLTTKGRP